MKAAPRQVASVTLDGRAVPLMARTSRRARSLLLRVDPAEDAIQLVLPRGVSLRDGLRFAEEKSGWILARLAAQPPRVKFAPGAVIPYRGIDHVIVHQPEERRGVWREKAAIRVSGNGEFLPRRVGDWLRREAQRLLDERSLAKAQAVDRPIRRISLRDPKTRWGSCAPDGSLNYSWRLVLAPDWILDYVVAHEVAHLVHANHGVRFWRLVAKLTERPGEARAWLRRHGDRLLRYG